MHLVAWRALVSRDLTSSAARSCADDGDRLELEGCFREFPRWSLIQIQRQIRGSKLSFRDLAHSGVVSMPNQCQHFGDWREQVPMSISENTPLLQRAGLLFLVR